MSEFTPFKHKSKKDHECVSPSTRVTWYRGNVYSGEMSSHCSRSGAELHVQGLQFNNEGCSKASGQKQKCENSKDKKVMLENANRIWNKD